MEKLPVEGSHGRVEFVDGKVIKRPFTCTGMSMNREYIAYNRMDCEKVLVPRLLSHKLGRDPSTGMAFVRELLFEDVGVNLSEWLYWQWFFDPIEVLLRPLLPTLDYLNRIGIIHADAHTGNVCLFRGKNGLLTAKLIDFGSSVVVRDDDEWTPHLSYENYWQDPRTGLYTEQHSCPQSDAGEVELQDLYNSLFHRDPLALIALCVTHDREFPCGLTLGHADDVYGLGMCVLRVLTRFVDVPWKDWKMFNSLHEVSESLSKMTILCQILRHNPAWHPSVFTDLHLRFSPRSWRTREDDQRMEAAARAVEIRAQSVDTLYPSFFLHMAEVYDKETSDEFRSCIHPDRNLRYPRVTKWLKERKTKRRLRQGDVDAVVIQSKGIIHISLVRCWMMTGVVGEGRVRWWNAAGTILSTTKTRNRRVAACALKKFIGKALEVDETLKERPFWEWPFDYGSQKEAWLKTLTSYGFGPPSPGTDMEPSPAPRSTDTNGPTG